MAMIDYNDEIQGRVIVNSEGIYLKDELPLLFFIVQAMSNDGTLPDFRETINFDDEGTAARRNVLIENGKIVHPVKGVTIAGRAFDILNSIDMIGNDLDMNRTNSAPTFRVAVIQIGGK